MFLVIQWLFVIVFCFPGRQTDIWGYNHGCFFCFFLCYDDVVMNMILSGFFLLGWLIYWGIYLCVIFQAFTEGGNFSRKGVVVILITERLSFFCDFLVIFVDGFEEINSLWIVWPYLLLELEEFCFRKEHNLGIIR